MSWNNATIEQTCDILDRLRKPITKSKRVAGPYPYYGATGILDHVEGYLFDEPLVLVGEDGAKWGIGDKTAFAIEGKVWVNNHAHVLRPKRDILSDKWLLYYMEATDLSPYITGLTVPKLNQQKLKTISFPLPPVSKQKEIVAILDKAFAGIGKAIENTEKNLASAKELFDSYLEKVFSNEGGDNKKLDDLCEIARGGSPRPIKSFLTDKEDGINWIKIADATASNKYIYKTKQKIKAEGISRSRLVKEGDFLLSNSMSFGRPYIMKTTGCIHDGWLVLSDKSGMYDQNYLYYFLSSKAAFNQFNNLARGSTVRNLNTDLVRGVMVPTPSIDIQVSIADKIEKISNSLDVIKDAYQQKLNALNELKQSLLQKAFRGELTSSDIFMAQEAAE